MKGKAKLRHPMEVESIRRLHLPNDAAAHFSIRYHRLLRQRMDRAAQYLPVPKTKSLSKYPLFLQNLKMASSSKQQKSNESEQVAQQSPDKGGEGQGQPMKENEYNALIDLTGESDPVEIPVEEGRGQDMSLSSRLVQATEKDLILAWNERCSLKRNRGDMEEVDVVEEELFRRKKSKKEEWYDAEGHLMMVTVTTMFGKQAYMVDEWGDLTPLSP